MNVRNCRNCGRIFNYVAGPALCPHCREELEKKFQQVKEYIENHKGVGIQEVAEECDVSPNQIHQWLREERLELVEGSGISLQCESCGAPITSGRLCEKCKREVTSGFQDVLKGSRENKPEPHRAGPDRDNPRMRYLERN